MGENLEIDVVYFYPKENAAQHHTDKFELVHDVLPLPILRRGQKFTVAVRFRGRNFEENKDLVRFLFSYGKLIFITFNFTPEEMH